MKEEGDYLAHKMDLIRQNSLVHGNDEELEQKAIYEISKFV